MKNLLVEASQISMVSNYVAIFWPYECKYKKKEQERKEIYGGAETYY